MKTTNFKKENTQKNTRTNTKAKKEMPEQNSVEIGLRAFNNVLAANGSVELANKALALGVASFLQVGKQHALPDAILTQCGNYIANVVMAGQVVPFTVNEILFQQAKLSSQISPP